MYLSIGIYIGNRRGAYVGDTKNRFFHCGSLHIFCVSTTIFTVSFDSFKSLSISRYVSKRDIENDEEIRQTSVHQRNCRFPDENILNVHRYYSYSACTVQCRKDRQMELCNCSSHLTPNSPDHELCNMDGLECLNQNYEDLSVIIAKWSRRRGRKGLVCDCLPSCTEVDITTVYDSKDNIYGYQNPVSKIEVALIELPTERYKRNLVRGKLDLVGKWKS